MPSLAFDSHLDVLLRDATQLLDARDQLREDSPGRRAGLGSLNRAVVIMCVSAWEAYLEELVREALTALRPPTPPWGVWPALNATVRGQLGRFNNPSLDNVRLLLSDAIGLPDIHHAWHWQNCTSAQVAQRLARAMELRHQIAHGVNPRPAVDFPYSIELPEFFRRIGRHTDRAVRAHLVGVHGIAEPWPV